MIDKSASLSVVKQCRLVSVSRSSVYYERAPVSPEQLRIMRTIDEIHLQRPFLGSRRIMAELKARGFDIGRKRAVRLMRLMRIKAVYPRPRTTTPGAGHKIYPYVLKNLTIDRANKAWAADITYIPMAKGFAYLVAIMDLYSRKILSWRLSNTADTRFCLEALQEALDDYGAPEIFNSDQGSQFTSADFTDVLKAKGVTISMDATGSWLDNVFIERFWRSVKYEEVYLHAYSDLREARAGLRRYIDGYYNAEHRHSSLARMTPDEVYQQSMGSRPTPSPAATPSSAALTTRPCS